MRHTILSLSTVTILLLLSCGARQNLTPSSAKAILDKIAAQTTTSQIVLNLNQARRVQSLGPTANGSLDVATAKPCLPDASDARVRIGQYLFCQGTIPPEVTWQQPGVLIHLKRPIAWTLIEVTGITDAPNTTNEKIVEYTWQYDLSPFPKEVQDALTYPPRPGKSLLRLYDNGWRFVAYQ